MAEAGIVPVTAEAYLLDGELVDLVALHAERQLFASADDVHTWNGALTVLLGYYEHWLEEPWGDAPAVLRERWAQVKALRGKRVQMDLARLASSRNARVEGEG